MIDSHCHLADRRFDKDRQMVFDRAHAAGVTHFVEIAYGPGIWEKGFDLAREHPNVFLALGVHPSESGRVPIAALDVLRDHARHARVVAIGETGLDFFRDYAAREDQERWFLAQLALADELGLPVVIHQRSALEDVMRILEQARPAAGGVLHCFDQDARTAERAQAIGFRLGLGGVLTYGHAALDEAVRHAPEDMLLLETDAPYLEPEPRSLRRNEPGLLPRVVRRLCELRDWTPAQAEAVTTRNARALFRLPLGGPASGGVG
jgi:TatD DNase family protein